MYVVTGVTGRTGRIVADGLLDRGERVRVVLRDPGKAGPWRERGAEIAVADLADIQSMTQALSGAEAIYLVKPPGYAYEDLFEKAHATTEAVAEAIRRAGPKRIVLLSSIGAGRDHGTGVIATNHRAEQRLSRLGIPIAFLRAAYFMENWARVLDSAVNDGVLPCLLSPVDRAIPMVATQDIGEIAADLMVKPWHGTRIVDVEGPRAYSPDDVASAFTRALGRSVGAVAIPPSEWGEVLGRNPFSRTAIDGFIAMNHALNSGHIAFDDAATDHLRGRRSIDEVVAAFLAMK